MKLGDVLQQLEQLEMHQAVYDEVVSHLERFLDGEETIPVATGDGTVPVRYVEEVAEALRQRSSALGEALAAAEEAEVGDVQFSLGGV